MCIFQYEDEKRLCEKSELVFLSIGITTDDIKHFNTNIWGGGIKTPLLFRCKTTYDTGQTRLKK